MLAFHWLMRSKTLLGTAHKLSWPVLGILWGAMILLILLSQESGKSFIYFQF